MSLSDDLRDIVDKKDDNETQTEHIARGILSYIQTNMHNIASVVVVLVNSDHVVQVLHTDLSFIETLGLLEIGKNVVIDDECNPWEEEDDDSTGKD